jgi:hypothetical protein
LVSNPVLWKLHFEDESLSYSVMYICRMAKEGNEKGGLKETKIGIREGES